MPSQLPAYLFVSWSLMICFVLAQMYHLDGIKKFRFAATQRHIKLLDISSTLGMLVIVGTLIYYFMVVRWWFVPILFITGSLAGALLAGLLFGISGEEHLSKRAFIMWPLCALFSILIIGTIAK